MRYITIEDKVYRVSESIYQKLVTKQKEINDKPYYNGSDVDMSNFIESLKPKMKLLGFIDFDFRL